MWKKGNWVIRMASVLLVIVVAVAGINYWIDPLWMYNHAHAYNQNQVATNERMQKVNQITFQPFFYDGLLLGGSRSVYMNQHEFKSMNVYNFTTQGIKLDEYRAMIDYAKQIRDKEFDTIIIGLDFNGTSVSTPGEGIRTYVQDTKTPFYKWRKLLSFQTLQYSIMNFQYSVDKITPSNTRIYNRQNIAVTASLSEVNYGKALKYDVTHLQDFLKDKYTYNEKYKALLETLKIENPSTKFIVYTEPLPEPFIDVIMQSSRIQEYKRWLRETVEVFGEVHHYMTKNSITQDPKNFYRPLYFDDAVGTMIAHDLSGAPDSNIPDDFGMVLTNDNIEAYLQSLDE